jgi:hypothetical protein
MLLIAGVVFPFVVNAGQYEQQPVLDASTILGDKIMSDNYRVDPVVYNDSRFNLFSATLNGYPERVISTALMAERLHEANAIGILRQIKETDAYKKGLDAALEAPLTLTRKTLEDPIAVLESIPDGLSNLMQDIGAALSSAGQGESKEENALIKDLIGFNTVKRRLASELGVDVYSSNQLLQQEIDDVAWSMFAGGAVIDVALTAAPLAASLAVEISDQANTGNLNWKVPPATLQQAIVEAVKKNGLNDSELETLVFHKTCSLSHLSSIVTNITALGSVAGIDMFYRQVNALTSEHECRAHQKLAELVYLYHVNKQSVKDIQIRGYSVWLTDTAGSQAIVVVADYLTYQSSNKNLLQPGNPTIWLSGKVSPAAMQVLNKNKVSVEQSVSQRYNAPLDIAQVLMPDRANQSIAQEDEKNRTHEVVDNVTEGVGEVVGGVLGALTAPLTGGSQHKTAEAESQVSDEYAY